MTELVTTVADKIDRAVQRVTPFAYRVRRRGRRWVRRALRKPSSVSEGPKRLPLLIPVLASYSCMSQLGMAAQSIDIVYQLTASEDSDPSIYQRGASPLESISFGTNGRADVTLKSLGGNDRLLAFRYHDLILLKNYSAQ